MLSPKLTESQLSRAGIGAFFRPRDVARLGITFYDLQRLVAEGKIENVGAGVYWLTSMQPDELETIALVAAAVPNGIVCLLSALRIHGIGTQSPAEVWLALDRKARKPVRLPARVRIVRFSGAMLTYGVNEISVSGVPARITNPARTVVDCFRYRHKLGNDFALEALRDAIRSRRATVDQILRAAEVCRAKSVVGPYLETLSG